jgi:hypothetical protein
MSKFFVQMRTLNKSHSITMFEFLVYTVIPVLLIAGCGLPHLFNYCYKYPLCMCYSFCANWRMVKSWFNSQWRQDIYVVPRASTLTVGPSSIIFGTGALSLGVTAQGYKADYSLLSTVGLPYVLIFPDMSSISRLKSPSGRNS